MLEGLTQNEFGLTLQHVRRRMRAVHPDAEVLTNLPDGIERTTFAAVADRVDRLAQALLALGIEPGDRVGSFAWNNRRHFELYLAAPCLGAVLHTVNVRLHPDQVLHTVADAGDRVVFVQDSLAPALATVADRLDAVERFVVVGPGDDGGLPRAVRYDDLLAAAPAGAPEYPELDERSAAALCYTSGTTGDPKGVLYSHRSLCLHASSLLMADALGLSMRDRVLALVPMSHINAWDLPFAAALAGSDLLLPDRDLSAPTLARFVADAGATVVACVPTVLLGLLDQVEAEGGDLTSLRLAVGGGSAVPPALARRLEALGVECCQAWGMTETSAISTVCRPSPRLGPDGAEAVRAKQGQPLPWVELRTVGEDGEPLVADGEATGEFEVRGPWIAAGYFHRDRAAAADGWLRTGDIGSLDEHGYMEISDRAKDVIKSGGEWISSVELENHLIAHEAVREAAVIACPDERWGERPLACVVLREGREAGPEELREHLAAEFPKWWLPERFAFVAEIPKTSVGKFDKKRLRGELAAGGLT